MENAHAFFKHKMTLTLIVLSALILTCTSFTLLKNRRKIPTLAHLQTFYQNWLNNEEKRLWDYIESTYGISKQECNELAQSLEESKEASIPLSADMHTLATAITREFNVSQAKVLGATPDASPARANKSSLYINEHKIKRYPFAAKKFIIAHESRHIANQDSCMGPAIQYFCACKGIEKNNDPNNIINKMARFFELRADMQTAIQSPEYAQGLIQAMDCFTQEGLIGRGISHPTLATRKAVGQRILKAHNQLRA